MKIDPHKPLPSHTKLRYEECYAKEFLEFLYPNKYKDLAIRDKPDLYDSINDVGIEVVEAENERKKEAVKLWYTMLYVSENKKQQNKERMKQLGEEYSEPIQIWQSDDYSKGLDSEPFVVLFDSIKSKLEKLNDGNYKVCKRYELFVESLMEFRKNLWEEVLEKLVSMSSEYRLRYDIIYVLTRETICSYDILFQKVIFNDITKDQVRIAMKAREMVIAGETERTSDENN